MWTTLLCCALMLWGSSYADTPANCTLDDVVGDWIFYEGPITTNPNIDCSVMPEVHRKMKMKLAPLVSMEDDWVVGTWTMVYNQGFDVFSNLRSYFTYSKYKQFKNGTVISYCDQTMVGRSHDVTLRHWACFYGVKQGSMMPKIHDDPFVDHMLHADEVPTIEDHQAIVDQANKMQNSWQAKVHEPFVDKTLEELLSIRGGKRSYLAHKVPANNSSKQTKDDVGFFDWRNLNGTNFVSPVRNQGSCGSCYAFSSTGMMESRIRVYSQNKLTPVLSPQDIVSCTDLSQGCEGGFPYLIAGKYGWESGLVDESCDPYVGQDMSCPRTPCDRHYTANYGYVGGYYGNCNEAYMIEALKNGPVSVSFNVYPDFYHYTSGIYHHTGVTGFHPFIPVNHAVLLVGYGVDNSTGEKYWIVKNSWGESWGENGYFKIRRGTDEVGIESIAVQAEPIPY